MNNQPRCDSCGKFIAARDFDHGATKVTISTKRSEEDYETICIKCNAENDMKKCG
jgi:hypothetical protein